ncbi:MAG TPA: alpha/beta hydrolase [Candidatus Acidoferrales bacterium]|nr:alpha/beta hydrolase [Candidatus Acidoferrales bacterium]
MKCTLAGAVLLLVPFAAASAQSPSVKTQSDVVYATHDGVSLKGDLYLPSSPGLHAAMLFIHGGGFRGGTKAGYAMTWGPYLAERGYVVFAIDYRLATDKQTMWPQALLDCKAALQYLRGNAAMLGIVPERIGVGGDSAGASLAALLGVTQDAPAFANKYPSDAYASASTKVKVDVPIYGVHDMFAWEKYTATAGNRGALEAFFGGTPEQVPGRYFAASPLDYVRESAKSLGEVATPNEGMHIAWFMAWGMVDHVVPPDGQSVAFAQALRDAGATVTTVPVPGVDHFWFTASPLTGQQGTLSCKDAPPPKRIVCEGATPNDFIAQQLLDFLAHNL